jgi:hypothetical protein
MDVTMAKELDLLKCVLPDNFFAGCIFSKLGALSRDAFVDELSHFFETSEAC